MIILLAILALGWPLAAWLYWSRRQERRLHFHIVQGWFAAALKREQQIAELREKINKARRNTGKAEI